MILIDMEMPRNCPNCPLMTFVPSGVTYGQSETGAYCVAGKYFIKIKDGQRFPDNCRMQEVVS